MGAQKGIIGSQQDERNFVSNLYNPAASQDRSEDGGWRMGGPVNGGRVPVIGEESSGHGSTSGQGFQGRKKQKPIRTNKQFAEPPPGGMPQQYAQQPGQRPPQHPQARSPHGPYPNSNRGGQQNVGALRKNNYL